MMRLFMSNEQKFLKAAENGDLDLVKKYIKNGVNKEVKDNIGRTALHYACGNDQLHIVRYLIETCHVDKVAKNNIGQTAYDLANLNNRGSVVQYLKKVSADSTKTTKVTNTQVETKSSITTENAVVVEQNMVSLTVDAPPGKLGIVIDTTFEGPVVHSINPKSPLEGTLFPGDIIVAIDDEDTRAMSAAAITAIMVRTANLRRKLTVLREYVVSPKKSCSTGEDDLIQKQGQKMKAHTEVNDDDSQSASDIASVAVVDQKNDTGASIQLEGRLLSGSISSPDILVPNPSSQAYELNTNWMSKLKDENEELIEKLNQMGSSVQFIDERRDILDIIVIEKCDTIEEYNEQSAILASPKHRDFYLLLQRKLKCMIKSCETLSSGMVGVGAGDYRSFIVKTIREKGCNVLKETKLGFFIGNAIAWARNNLAVVPFVDSIGSIFQLIVTLKDERDRYIGLAGVADFAAMACLQHYGTTSLDHAIEKFARLIVRARCGLPSCRFVEEQDELGKFKMLMIQLLADSDNTLAKEQASKAADCAFAHIMKPGRDSLLYAVLYGDTFDVALYEALAASTLGCCVNDLRALEAFATISQAVIQSNTETNNRSRIVPVNTSDVRLYGTSLHADSFASSDVVAELEVKNQKQDEMIQKLVAEVEFLKKKIKQSDSRTNYDAGGGLVYVNPAGCLKDDITSLQIAVDELRAYAIVADSRMLRHEESIDGCERNIDLNMDVVWQNMSHKQKEKFKLRQEKKVMQWEKANAENIRTQQEDNKCITGSQWGKEEDNFCIRKDDDYENENMV